MELPKDIGGYQHLEPDVILNAHDIVVINGEVEGFVHFFSSLGGAMNVGEAEKKLGANIYRKYPCPRQGGNRELTTEEKEYQAKLAEQAAHTQKQWKSVQTPKASTHDNGKPPLACLPLKALRMVALVQLYGQKKYGDFYNYKKGMEVSRNASCSMRHIADFMDGIDLDGESGEHHLAHACCRLLFILENIADKTAIDDRYKK